MFTGLRHGREPPPLVSCAGSFATAFLDVGRLRGFAGLGKISLAGGLRLLKTLRLVELGPKSEGK